MRTLQIYPFHSFDVRSACYASLEKYDLALKAVDRYACDGALMWSVVGQDGEECVKLKPETALACGAVFLHVIDHSLGLSMCGCNVGSNVIEGSIEQFGIPTQCCCQSRAARDSHIVMFLVWSIWQSP